MLLREAFLAGIGAVGAALCVATGWAFAALAALAGGAAGDLCAAAAAAAAAFWLRARSNSAINSEVLLLLPLL